MIVFIYLTWSTILWTVNLLVVREIVKKKAAPHRESQFDDLINKKRQSYTVAQWEDGGESSNKLLISLWNQPNS